MASASFGSNMKAKKQHQLQVASALNALSNNQNPFPIDMGFFSKHKKYPHQHAEPREAGVKGKDERELGGYRRYLGCQKPKDIGMTEESIKFCTEDRCTIASVEDGLNTLELGFRSHACHTAGYQNSHPPATCKLMLQYLNDNPIDGDKIPTTDVHCYEARNKMVDTVSDKGEKVKVIKKVPTETQFYKDYKSLRNDVYKYLRASIPMYLDEQANSQLREYIAGLERAKKPPLTDHDKISDMKRRVKYSKIKKYILRHLTNRTPGSFYFKSLLCKWRTDGTPILSWCDDVQKTVNVVVDHGQGWEHVIDREAVLKLYDWTGDGERKLIKKGFSKLGRPNSVTDKSIVNEESFEDLLKVTRGVERTTWPTTPFKASWCPEGKSKLLHTDEKFARVTGELATSLNKFKQLSNLFDDYKRKHNHKRGRETLKPNPKDDTTPGDQPPGKKPRKPNKPTPICKLCMKAGLGKRAHKTEDCDPALRAKAVESKKRRELAAATASLHNRKKSRYSLDETGNPNNQYPPDACKHCVAAGRNPKVTTNHNPETCCLKPEGAVQTLLGVSYTQMINNTSRDRINEAITAYFNERKTRAKAAKANKGKNKKVQFEPKTTETNYRQPPTADGTRTGRGRGRGRGGRGRGRGRGRTGRGRGRGRARGRGRGKRKWAVPLSSLPMGHENFGQLPPGLTQGEIKFFSHKTFKDEFPDGGSAMHASTEHLATHKADREQNRREYLADIARRQAQREKDEQALLQFADDPPEPAHSTSTNSTLLTPEVTNDSGPPPEAKTIGEEYVKRMEEDEQIRLSNEDAGVRIHDTLTPLPFRPNPYNPTGYDNTDRRQIETVTFKSHSGARIDIPMETWCPASRNSVPIARTCMTNNKSNPLQSQTDSTKQLLSETRGYRLLQAYINYRDACGNIRRGRIQLDTQSNCSYTLPDVGLPRDWRPYETKTVMGLKREVIPLGNPNTITIMKDDTPVVIDTNEPHKGKLSGDCVALLGWEAIQALGIDINHAMKYNTHQQARFINDTQTTVDKCDELSLNFMVDYAAPISPVDMTPERICLLSEKIVEEYNRTHPNEYELKAINPHNLDINPALPEEIKALILALVDQYKDVLAEYTNTLPECMKDVKPHEFKLKPDAKPIPVPKPRFGPAKSKLILDWLEWALSVGLVEKANTTSYASRLILAPCQVQGRHAQNCTS